MTGHGLIAATEAALEEKPNQRTVLVEHNGQRYIAKRLAERPRRLTQTLFMRWLVKRITGQSLPLRTLSLSEAAGSMEYEAQRLRALGSAGAGATVPAIVYRTLEYLLLEHRGEVVANLLENWTPDVWRYELTRMAQELGQFHAAGLWHGGAQIKNVTLQNGVFTRIDFEENFGEFLPLPVVQANDLILFLNSISLAGPINETESRTLLPKLLESYFAAYPDPEVIQVLQRALPWLKRIGTLAAPLQRFSKKGIRRILILVNVLESALATTPRKP